MAYPFIGRKVRHSYSEESRMSTYIYTIHLETGEKIDTLNPTVYNFWNAHKRMERLVGRSYIMDLNGDEYIVSLEFVYMVSRKEIHNEP